MSPELDAVEESLADLDEDMHTDELSDEELKEAMTRMSKAKEAGVFE